MDLITLALAVKKTLAELGVKTETTSKVLLEETEYAFDLMDEDAGLYGSPIGNYELTDALLDKLSCTVHFDGVAYPCKLKDYEGTYGFGNSAIVGVGEDTGEPFGCVVYSNGAILCITLDPAEKHTIGITYKTETIHPIDPKFLPEASQTVSIDLDKYDEIAAALIGLVAQGGGETTIADVGDFWNVLDKNLLCDVRLGMTVDTTYVIARGVTRGISYSGGYPHTGSLSFGFAAYSFGNYFVVNCFITHYSENDSVGARIFLKVT